MQDFSQAVAGKLLQLEFLMRSCLLEAFVLLGCAAPVLSQSAASSQTPALQEELRKLGQAALSLQHDLPSFQCMETGLSEVLTKNKVKDHVRFAADLRVQPGEKGRLREQLQVTEVNGKRYSGGGFQPPFMVRGGFGESLFFFLPRTQGCFNYTLSPGRIDFDSPPGTFERPECAETGAPRGFALLDADGDAIHLERQVAEDHALEMHVVNFTAIDFSPVELGGRVYRLTSKVVAEVPRDGEMLHFEAVYSACRLFRATSTILPDATPVPEDQPPHP